MAATSPETLLALSEPTSSRTCTSPETALTVRSPVSPSTMMSPDTVLRRASLRMPDTSALALTTPRVRATERGTATLISAFGPLAAEVAEHLEEVVPAQLRVIDLDRDRR